MGALYGSAPGASLDLERLRLQKHIPQPREYLKFGLLLRIDNPKATTLLLIVRAVLCLSRQVLARLCILKAIGEYAVAPAIKATDHGPSKEGRAEPRGHEGEERPRTRAEQGSEGSQGRALSLRSRQGLTSRN